jgi:hypothetical protein
MKSLMLSVALVGVVMTASSANAALTVGDSIVVQYLAPDANSAFGAPVATTYTGAGQVVVSSTNFAFVTLFDNSVVFTPTFIAFQAAAFNGLALTNITNSNAFSGWSLTGGQTGISGTILSNSRIGASWAGRLLANTAPATFTGPTPVTPPPTGAVPEPASWAMLITGFGLVGAAARRRRVVTVAS